MSAQAGEKPEVALAQRDEECGEMQAWPSGRVWRCFAKKGHPEGRHNFVVEIHP